MTSVQNVPPGSILVAFDRTPGSEAALDEATRLALALRVPIELLYVRPTLVDHERGRKLPVSLEEMENACSERVRALDQAGASASHHVEFGDPPTRLLEMAGSGRFWMLAMGTHGRTGLSRLTMGSVAEEVVRRSAVPVLTVRRREPATSPPPRRATGRVLVATDFSEPSLAAVARAVELARGTGAQLLLEHVFEPVVIPYPAPPSAWFFDDTAARDRLEEERRTLERELGAGRVTAILDTGTPRDRLLHAIAEHDPDVLVLGTHGRTGISRLALGSVAENIVRRASCPVLTVRAPK